MKVLVACEFSGIVREAFKKRGHDAWSCDLLDTEIPGNHIKGDVLARLDDGWDLMIAHPPCTYLAVSGSAWLNSPLYPNRRKDQTKAFEFFMRFANAPVERICVENPVSVVSSMWRKPDQIIHPYMFGDEASKPTCLWLKNLPPLFHLDRPNLFGDKVTHVGKGEFVTTSTGRRGAKWNWWLPPGPERAKIRSRTFQGIAEAMAEQWGSLNDRDIL